MSYIRTRDTYAYPDGDGGLIIHTNHVSDQAAGNIGSEHKFDHNLRYLVQIPAEEFRSMVRRILEEHRPTWVTNTMLDQWMRLRAEADEKFKKECGG